jgi:hypothetical protein
MQLLMSAAARATIGVRNECQTALSCIGDDLVERSMLIDAGRKLRTSPCVLAM